MKTFFMILVILLTFLVGYIIGTKTELSYEDKNAQVENALKTNEDYEEEYASETNEKFYKKMVRMERNSTLVFNGFPTCLTSILYTHTQPGDEILTTGTDTLYLVDWDLNRADINRYICYLVKDNHDNLWSIFRHNENFHLNRVDEVKNKNLLKIRKPNYGNWLLKAIEEPSGISWGFNLK